MSHLMNGAMNLIWLRDKMSEEKEKEWFVVDIVAPEDGPEFHATFDTYEEAKGFYAYQKSNSTWIKRLTAHTDTTIRIIESN